jgi:hypothetical protein
MYNVSVFKHNFSYWTKQQYGCETGALSLTADHKFNAFENNMPGRIFGRKENRKRNRDRQRRTQNIAS